MRSRQQKEVEKAKEETRKEKDAQEEKHLRRKDLAGFSTQNKVATKETSVLLSTEQETKEVETAVPRGNAEESEVERETETKDTASLNKEKEQVLE